MGNMSYCRFENTLADLQDCLDHIDDELDGFEEQSRMELIDVCENIISAYEEE